MINERSLVFNVSHGKRLSFCRYGSLYATSLLRKLREDGVYMRPLGNVIYLMCGPCTSPEVCQQLLIKLHRRLEDFNKAEAKLVSC